ncbi:hypothetical protein VOLCADRAFT_103177 [Volvox carteri f. nagariensis]|uniref:U-box domain-containing protein n=1 Tax=Volvox carteri f. nagariensis TaxID=3068 RepID=D8TJZ2_VOLCA|nr:uncharacterized protein VOLCADRAFT_103177 [Volvox carteri f. nagariensis]EFJ52156.1 hypothetical protein VOLCADRAFT_103177 [Volvox carteri f. nagariensis]|eukprot:XP_002946930.1 hypothetical protein VOLCADRAFT_103177 [Volvox carteri f. nagariensis]
MILTGVALAACAALTHTAIDSTRKYAASIIGIAPDGLVTVPALLDMVISCAGVALTGRWRGTIKHPTLFATATITSSLLLLVSRYMYQRAIQLSPLSLTIPYLAFTPAILIATAYIFLGELPSPTGLVGVCVVAMGGYLLNLRAGGSAAAGSGSGGVAASGGAAGAGGKASGLTASSSLSALASAEISGVVVQVAATALPSMGSGTTSSASGGAAGPAAGFLMQRSASVATTSDLETGGVGGAGAGGAPGGGGGKRGSKGLSVHHRRLPSASELLMLRSSYHHQQILTSWQQEPGTLLMIERSSSGRLYQTGFDYATIRLLECGSCVAAKEEPKAAIAKLFELSSSEVSKFVKVIAALLNRPNLDLEFLPQEFEDLTPSPDGVYSYAPGSYNPLLFRRSGTEADPGAWQWSDDGQHWFATDNVRESPHGLPEPPALVFILRLHVEYLIRRRLANPAVLHRRLPAPLDLGTCPRGVLDAAPEPLCCPISHSVMRLPVVSPSGTTFEYDCIRRWAQRHNTDPVNGAPLAEGDLYPNLALRDIIERWLRQQKSSQQQQQQQHSEMEQKPQEQLQGRGTEKEEDDDEEEGTSEEAEIWARGRPEGAGRGGRRGETTGGGQGEVAAAGGPGRETLEEEEVEVTADTVHLADEAVGGFEGAAGKAGTLKDDFFTNMLLWSCVWS